VIASAILIVFGVATIVVAVTGRADVHDAIEREQIIGSPDMTPEPRGRPWRRPAAQRNRILVLTLGLASRDRQTAAA
jgi:hypothetical protein